MPYII